jgi:hypothetical protein
LSETNLPARSERRITTRPPADRSSTPIDRNILTWPIFATPGTVGFRRLKPKVEIENGIEVTRSVSVGVYEDTQETLDDFDQLVFFHICERWINDGGDLADRRVFGSLTSLLRRINGRAAGARFNSEEIERIRHSIDKLASVPTKWDRAYKQLDGYTTQTITLLERATVFNRDKSLKGGGKYHGTSEYVLHEDVARNMKQNFKLILLDVLDRIKNPYARIIYTILESNLPTARLEIVKGRPYRRYNKKVMDLAAEIGMKTNKPENVRAILRRACEALVGAFLTDGMIATCGIEKSKSTGEWIFYATYAIRDTTPIEVPAITATPAAAVAVAAPSSPAAPATPPAAKEELAEAQRFYELLAPAEREKIDTIKARAFADRYKKFPAMERYAFLDAVEEYARERILGMMSAPAGPTPSLVAREQCLTPYMSAGERLLKEEEARKKSLETNSKNPS